MSVDPLSSLPVVPDTALPADVRNGSTADKQAYQAALGFERVLLEQLTQSMVDTTGSGDASDSGDGSGSSDAVTQAYNQMLPGQLADSLTSAGGTGLADNLYRALREGQS
ncbi:MAG TPA: rod-binding protein [Thermoleophilaceae bacterium]